MIADSDRIPEAETLSIRDDGIVRVLVLRVELETRPPHPTRKATAIQLWHQRIDWRSRPGGRERPLAARCLMIYSDTDQGRQAAESLADHLAGMA